MEKNDLLEEEINEIQEIIEDDNKNNRKKTATNNLKKDIVDLEKVFIDPANKLYKPFYDSFNDEFYEIIKKEIIKNSNIDETTEQKNQNIQSKVNEIKNNKKTNKIGARKFSNVLIGILFVILIGLFFIKFFKKNKKIIKEFNDFKNKKVTEINELGDQKASDLINIFGYHNLNYIKNLFLQKYGITNVKNIVYDEIKLFENTRDFCGFNYVSKYDIRNSYIYDLVYSQIRYRNITTSASISVYVSNSNGDGGHYETYTGYHTEPTPFIDFTNAITIPTNYLPSLSFSKIGDGYSSSEIKKIKKLGKTLPENDDFNHSFKFTYNDEIKFIQYFTLTTQNNFLKIKEHFHISDFKKEKNNLYTYSFTDINNSEYDPKMNWLIDYINNNRFLINVDSIVEKIRANVWDSINNIFKMLTISYCNKNIFSESFEEIGSGYVSDYKDDNTYSTDSKGGFINLLSAINVSKPFTWNKQYDLRKDNYYFADKHEKYNDYIFQDISMNSWHAVDEIDDVIVHGHIIEVPYVRFYPIHEKKRVIFTTNYHLSNQDSLIQTENSNLYLNYTNDQYYDNLIQKNNIYINEISFKDPREVQDAIITIDNFYNQFPKLKNVSKIIINDDLLGIFINDDKILRTENNEYSFANISNALKRLYSPK